MVRDITDIIQTLLILYLLFRVRQQGGLINEITKELLKTVRKVFNCLYAIVGIMF